MEMLFKTPSPEILIVRFKLIVSTPTSAKFPWNSNSSAVTLPLNVPFSLKYSLKVLFVTTACSPAVTIGESSSTLSFSSLITFSSIAISSTLSSTATALALSSLTAKLAPNENNTTERTINASNKLFDLIITPHIYLINKNNSLYKNKIIKK